MMPTQMSRFGVLSLFCLLSACQTFEDGDKRLYEQSNRLFEESLEQNQLKVVPPVSVQAGLIRRWQLTTWSCRGLVSMWPSATCRPANFS